MPTMAKDVLGGCKDSMQITASAGKSFAKKEISGIRGNAEDWAEEKFSSETRTGRAMQTGTVMTIVTLGILGIIGVLVYSQVSTSLPQPEDNQLQNASDDIDGGFADSMGLLPVVLIIMMAALVIAVVSRFRA